MRKFQSRSFIKSIGYALNGLRLAFKTQKNFKRHLIITTVLIGAALCIKLNPTALCIVILANAWVLICELINSIIEFIVDSYYRTKWSKLAKMAKDMGAAVVLLSSVIAVLVTTILVVEKFIS